jgi:hypothetical protein
LNRNTCLGGFGFIFIILVASSFAAPVQAAVTQKYRASFYCAAGGEALCVTKWDDKGYMVDWLVGKSAVALAGSGVVERQQPSDHVPDVHYTTNNGVVARGGIHASWGKQELNVLLYANEAGGLFIDTNKYPDIFLFGLPGGGNVNYKGTYRDASGTHVVSGAASISAGFAPGSDLIRMISFNLGRPDGTILVSVIFINADLSAMGWAHAPYLFSQSVKITTLS